MAANPSRLELFVDIFEQKTQRALILPTLTPPEFVGAILQEFRELPYLSDSPDIYQLVRAGDRSPLSADGQLGKQVANKDRLALVEYELPLPQEARRPSRHIYLREDATGKVYKLQWLPAIIGRPDPDQPHDDWLAVDLATHERGLRVSRRHALITEENGMYFVQGLSQNQTTIRDIQSAATAINTNKHALHNGYTIYLDYSQIALKFIVRDI